MGDDDLPHHAVLDQEHILLTISGIGESYSAFVLHPDYQLVLVRLEVLVVKDEEHGDWDSVPEDGTPVKEHLICKGVRDIIGEKVDDSSRGVSEHKYQVVVAQGLLAVLNWCI